MSDQDSSSVAESLAVISEFVKEHEDVPLSKETLEVLAIARAVSDAYAHGDFMTAVFKAAVQARFLDHSFCWD